MRQISIFFCSFLLDFSPILCNYIINNNHHHIHVTLDDEQTTLFFYSAKMPFHQKNNENKYFISCYRITEKGSQIVIIYPGPGTLQFEIWVPKYSFITLKFFRFWIFLSKNCSWGFIISKWHNFWTILILNLIITVKKIMSKWIITQNFWLFGEKCQKRQIWSIINYPHHFKLIYYYTGQTSPTRAN